jgi:hypothetical protein
MYSVSSLNNDFIKPLNTVKSQASFFKTIHDCSTRSTFHESALLLASLWLNLLVGCCAERHKSSNGNQLLDTLAVHDLLVGLFLKSKERRESYQ